MKAVLDHAIQPNATGQFEPFGLGAEAPSAKDGPQQGMHSKAGCD
jgi:hypothetical protein